MSINAQRSCPGSVTQQVALASASGPAGLLPRPRPQDLPYTDSLPTHGNNLEIYFSIGCRLTWLSLSQAAQSMGG